MAREMSNGSVQIYSLDGPAEPMAPVPPAAVYPPVLQDGGVPSPGDPNVIVYPFIEESTYPQEARPLLSPPSGQYRPLHSPFGGPLQSPAPVESHSDASRIYFRHGSSALDEAGMQVINYTALTGGAIIVSGHASERTETADPIENDIINLKLSMDRAFRVSSALIRDGVPAENIETRAYGDAKPGMPVPGTEREQADRRVEIIVDGARY